MRTNTYTILARVALPVLLVGVMILVGPEFARPAYGDHGPEESHDAALSAHGEASHSDIFSEHGEASHSDVFSAHGEASHSDVFSEHSEASHQDIFSSHGEASHSDVFSEHGEASHLDVFSSHGDASHSDVFSEHGEASHSGIFSAHGEASHSDVFSEHGDASHLDIFSAHGDASHADGGILVAIPSPYTLGRRMWSREHSRSAYATREEFMEACMPIIRAEIQELARLGADAVQLDDPWLALLVDPTYREREGVTDIEAEIELCVKCVNGATEGIEGVSLSLHLCHAHFDRRHVTKGPYDLIIGALGRMNVDRFAMEFSTPDAGGVGSLRNFLGDKTLGLGVIDHTDPHVETPDEVVARVEAAMEYVPAGRIMLNPDCGFAPSSANPMDLDEAYLKLRAMCRGARPLRDKYG